MWNKRQRGQLQLDLEGHEDVDRWHLDCEHWWKFIRKIRIIPIQSNFGYVKKQTKIKEIITANRSTEKCQKKPLQALSKTWSVRKLSVQRSEQPNLQYLLETSSHP